MSFRKLAIPLVVGRQLARQPHQLDVALRLTLQVPARPHAVQETAELITGFDVLVTVDTSADLAGAMGVPVWILLPYVNADWRWLAGRTGSPWYPSARLFRQRRPGDWEGVLSEVVAALSP